MAKRPGTAPRPVARPYALVGRKAPVLGLVAKPVEDPKDPALGMIIRRMLATCRVKGGLGIAAPQVGLGLRLVVTWEGKVLVNPSYEPVGDDTELAPEACLSLPGRSYQVRRYTRVRARCVDVNGGDVVEWLAEGFDARFLQHEVDHLDGRLISDLGPEVAQSIGVKL